MNGNIQNNNNSIQQTNSFPVDISPTKEPLSEIDQKIYCYSTLNINLDWMDKEKINIQNDFKKINNNIPETESLIDVIDAVKVLQGKFGLLEGDLAACKTAEYQEVINQFKNQLTKDQKWINNIEEEEIGLLHVLFLNLLTKANHNQFDFEDSMLIENIVKLYQKHPSLQDNKDLRDQYNEYLLNKKNMVGIGVNEEINLRIKQLPISFQTAIFNKLSGNNTLLEEVNIERSIKTFETLSKIKTNLKNGLLPLLADEINHSAQIKPPIPFPALSTLIKHLHQEPNENICNEVIALLNDDTLGKNVLISSYFNHHFEFVTLDHLLNDLKTLKTMSLSLSNPHKIHLVSNLSTVIKLWTLNPGYTKELFDQINHLPKSILNFLINTGIKNPSQSKLILDLILKAPEFTKNNFSQLITDHPELTSSPALDSVLRWFSGMTSTKEPSKTEEFLIYFIRIFNCIRNNTTLLNPLESLKDDQLLIWKEILESSNNKLLTRDSIKNIFKSKNEEALFNEIYNCPKSLTPCIDYFRQHPEKSKPFSEWLKNILQIDTDVISIEDLLKQTTEIHWDCLEKIFSMNPEAIDFILKNINISSSIYFVSHLQNIYEQSPTVGKFLVAFRAEYPEKSGSLIELIQKIGIVKTSHLLLNANGSFNELHQLINLSHLPAAVLLKILNWREENTEITSALIQLASYPEGANVIEILQEHLEKLPKELVFQMVENPLFLKRFNGVVNSIPTESLSVFVENLSIFQKDNMCDSALLLASYESQFLTNSYQGTPLNFKFALSDFLVLLPTNLPKETMRKIAVALVKLSSNQVTTSTSSESESLKTLSLELFLNLKDLIKENSAASLDKLNKFCDLVIAEEYTLIPYLFMPPFVEGSSEARSLKNDILNQMALKLERPTTRLCKTLTDLDPVKDEKLLMWIQKTCVNSDEIPPILLSIMELKRQNQDTLIHHIISIDEPVSSTSTSWFSSYAPSLLQKGWGYFKATPVDWKNRNTILLALLEEQNVSLAKAVFIQPATFWEGSTTFNEKPISLTLQKQLWDLHLDLLPTGIPKTVQTFLTTILTKEKSEPDLLKALGILQFYIKSDRLDEKKLSQLHGAADLINDFQSHPLNPAASLKKILLDHDSMVFLTPSDKENHLEYAITKYLASHIITHRGGINIEMIKIVTQIIDNHPSLHLLGSFKIHIDHVLQDFINYPHAYAEKLTSAGTPPKKSFMTPSEKLIRQISGKVESDSITPINCQEAIVSALLTRVRQHSERGSCFATQTVIEAQSSHQSRLQLTDDYVELIKNNSLTKNQGKHAYPIVLDITDESGKIYHPLTRSIEYTIAQMRGSDTAHKYLKTHLITYGSDGFIGRHMNQIIDDKLKLNQKDKESLLLTLSSELGKTFLSQSELAYAFKKFEDTNKTLFGWLLIDNETGASVDDLAQYYFFTHKIIQKTLMKATSTSQQQQDQINIVLTELKNTIKDGKKFQGEVNKDMKNSIGILQQLFVPWRPFHTGGESSRKYYFEIPETTATKKIMMKNGEAILNSIENYTIPTISFQGPKRNPSIQKIGVVFPKHACNINIGVLLNDSPEKIPSSQILLNEAEESRKQRIAPQQISEIINKLNELKLIEPPFTSNYQSKILTFKDMIISEFTKSLCDELCIYYDCTPLQLKHRFILETVIHQYLKENSFNVTTAIPLIDTNWYAQDHQDVVYGFRGSLWDGSIKAVKLGFNNKEEVCDFDFLGKTMELLPPIHASSGS